MEIQKISSQNFGMAVHYRPDYDTVRGFIYGNYGREVNDAISNITKLQSRNPYDIFLSVVEKNGRKVLKAEVEDNSYTEGFWNSAKRVLSKAESYANKLHREKKELDRLLNK